MNEQEKITNGEDISLDNGNVIVLNRISVAEKTSKEEIKTESDESKNLQKVEMPSIESKETTEVPTALDAASTVNVEVPPVSNTANIPIADEPIIPTIDSVVPKEVEFSNNGTPISIASEQSIPSVEIPIAPEVQPPIADENKYKEFETNNSNDSIYSPNAYNTSFNNFDNYSSALNEHNYADSGVIPGNVESALVELRSAVLNSVGEVTHLKEENSKLILVNDDLKRKLDNKEKEVESLKTSIINMEHQVKTMQARVLDMFGMGNIKPNPDGFYNQNNANSYNQNSYNDDANNIRNIAA